MSQPPTPDYESILEWEGTPKLHELAGGRGYYGQHDHPLHRPRAVRISREAWENPGRELLEACAALDETRRQRDAGIEALRYRRRATDAVEAPGRPMSEVEAEARAEALRRRWRRTRRSPWPRIAFQDVELGARERELVLEVLESGRLTHGAKVLELEDALAAAAGVRHAVACSSGTAALHLAMLALGLERGDYVLVPATTYVATANAVAYCGAIPVPVDVDPATWTISVEAVRRCLETDGTRVVGIVAVHLAGVPADVSALREVIGPERWLLEDAAQAIGAIERIPGSTETWRAGGIPGSNAGVFSLHASKAVTAGEGGAVVTEDAELAERARLYRGQGHEPAPDAYYRHVVRGHNYRLNELAAAVALGQLERLEGVLLRRRQLAAAYLELLRDVDGVTVQATRLGYSTPARWTVAVCTDGDAAVIVAELAERNIEARQMFLPIGDQPMAPSAVPVPIADGLSAQAIMLPLHTRMELADVERVVAELEDILEGGR